MLQAPLERIVAPGTVLHRQGEHLCHKGILRLQRQRLVIIVDGILNSILRSREVSITSGDTTAMEGPSLHMKSSELGCMKQAIEEGSLSEFMAQFGVQQW